ncbi:Methionine-binding lipoprotein metQ precursor [Raoultella planticola]|uniref:Methionine-binding lipoprotein metQ n=1 Tax=Raoultella planticola TaxID=575 RepID=A0A485C5K6_RAOPL|nr:Methionine-binding lipoprotein metQ precursor [Raoultella planticola]
MVVEAGGGRQWLRAFNHGTGIQWAFGIYSDRYTSVKDLPNGATIVVPDDGANQGQALWLLQRIGLVTLDPKVEPRTAKLKNIVGNPHQFNFKELDLLTMPRALNSVDAAIRLCLAV